MNDLTTHDRSTVAVDFDGVIHSYTSPFTQPAVIPDPPVEGALEWLYDLLGEFDVVIMSSRAEDTYTAVAMQEWLHRHSPTEEMWAGTSEHGGLADIDIVDWKVPAILYIDDRGYHFKGPGTFPTIEWIQAFAPWNRKPIMPEDEGSAE